MGKKINKHDFTDDAPILTENIGKKISQDVVDSLKKKFKRVFKEPPIIRPVEKPIEK